MRNSFLSLIVIGGAALALSPNLVAQDAEPPRGAPTQVQQLEKNGPGGPAPRRDLVGAWAGPINSTPKPEAYPPYTPLGLAQSKLYIPGTFSARSNDPWLSCDPYGFPRNLVQEPKGLIFAQMPDRMIMLSQYDRIGRIVWMDGRQLPKNVDEVGGPKSRWYGYSVGHWEGDYTLVVNTNGVVDNTWLDQPGHPHSSDLRVEERYTRVSYNVLQATVTIDDPKYYTKPFLFATTTYRWIASKEPSFGTTGEFDEQFCVPSEMADYNKIMRDAADEDHTVNQK